MNVDFCYVPGGPSAEVAALAALGERLGFRCMWIPDQGFYRDPFLLAAAAATATTTIDIGIGITMPVTRHPVQIARAAGTLDEMSGGRMRLGLGSGNVEHVVKPMGLPTDNLVGRVRAGVEQVRTLLRGEPVPYADGHPQVRLDFTPARVIPLYVGARGPKMLEMAGAVADGVLMESLFHGGGLAHALESVHRGRQARHATPPPLDAVSWQVLVVTDDPKREIDAYRPWIARILQGGPVEALVRIGVAEDTVRAVRVAGAAGREQEAIGAVTDDAARCLLLIGTPDEIVERIDDLGARGCTSVSVLSTKGFAETAENLTRIGTTVLPALAGAATGGA